LGLVLLKKKSWEIKTKIAFFKGDSCYSIHFNKTSFFDAQVKVPLLIFYKPNIQDWNWQQICKAENKVLLEIASQQENDMVSELLLSSRLSQGKSNAEDLISRYFQVEFFEDFYWMYGLEELPISGKDKLLTIGMEQKSWWMVRWISILLPAKRFKDFVNWFSRL